MSGREPVAAFFPSIDRNLMAELDRHLRTAKTAPPPAPSEPPPPLARPDIEDVVEAVEHAASSLAAMTARIEQLESQVESLQVTNRELSLQLAQSAQRQGAAEAQALAHHGRAEEAGRIAAQHAARADLMERDLATALTDLNRVTNAIADALGLPDTP